MIEQFESGPCLPVAASGFWRVTQVVCGVSVGQQEEIELYLDRGIRQSEYGKCQLECVQGS